MRSALRSSKRPRKQRKTRFFTEILEPRQCLSAAASDFPQSIVEIEWNGNSFEALEDSWVARTNSVVGEHFITTGNLPPSWSSQPIGDGFHSITSPGATLEQVAGWASQTPGIAYIEPNAVIHSFATPTDPDYGLLWGLENTGQTGGLDGWDQGLVGTPGVDISANEAWDITTGSRDVVIAVIDSGVDYLHPDLQDNIWVNTGEIAGNGIDDDGNGYIDDINGWDFADGDSDPMDANGHGTHVAGTIGASANNGIGVAGVAWDVQVMALKAFPDSGLAFTAGFIEAITYASDMRRSGVNVVASNNSWGGGGYSQALFDAIEDAGRAGVLFVAAAGNDMRNNNDTNPVYPASYDSDNIISVAATARDNSLALFSNIGRTSVDLAAPGVGIWSTTPNNTYAGYSGTSMASPHVAGVVALLASAQPNATSSELRNAILAGARLNPNPRVRGLVATNGQLNALDSLNYFVPPSPTATIAPVTPNPRFTGDGVNSIRISFDLGVQGFDLSDLELTRDNTPIALGSATLTAIDTKTYTLNDISVLTGPDGDYTLTLVAAGSDIVDIEKGVAIEGDAVASWTVMPPPPFEMNDTLASAPLLDVSSGAVTIAAFVGDGYNGRADVDLFRVSLEADTSYEFDIDARALENGSLLDSYLRVFDSLGRQLAFNDDARGSLDSRLVYTAPQAGDYYLGVSAYGNTAYNPSFSGSGRAAPSFGEYTLTAEALSTPQPPAPPPTEPPVAPPSDPPVAAVEPNDSVQTATVMIFDGQTARAEGFIGDGQFQSADVDFYAIDVVAGTRIVIDIDARELPDPSHLDSYLRLFSASGHLLATNDDANGSLDSRLTTQLTDAGTYYIGVSAFGNSQYGPFESGSGRAARSTGDYVLSVSADTTPPEPPEPPAPPAPPPPTADSPEPDDSTETATALVPVDGVATALGVIGDGAYGLADVDIYAVHLAAGTEVIASVATQGLASPSSLDSYLRLFNASGRLVAANDDYGDSLDSRIFFTVPETGMYYLGVSAFGNYFYDVTRAGSGRIAHTFGNYELTLEVSDSVRAAAFSTMSGPSSGQGGSTRTLTR